MRLSCSFECASQTMTFDRVFKLRTGPAAVYESLISCCFEVLDRKERPSVEFFLIKPVHMQAHHRLHMRPQRSQHKSPSSPLMLDLPPLQRSQLSMPDDAEAWTMSQRLKAWRATMKSAWRALPSWPALRSPQGTLCRQLKLAPGCAGCSSLHIA